MTGEFEREKNPSTVQRKSDEFQDLNGGKEF